MPAPDSVSRPTAGSGGDGETASAPVVKLVRATSRQSIPVHMRVGRVSVVGNGPDTDVHLEDAGVLERHANLVWGDSGLQVEPIGSAPVAVNGQAVTGPTPVQAGDWLALGDRVFQVTIDAATGGTTERIAQPVQTARMPSASERVTVQESPSRVITIGRLPDNDVQIPSPVVSRHHARVVRSNGTWFIEDLNSTNGSFVDGTRVEGRLPLQGGERVEIGSFAFAFADGALRRLDGAGAIRLEARGLQKTVSDAATGKPKDLLSEVSLAVHPGEFVGIFGTSGSGKSTLLDALNGRRPVTSGKVLYNGTDLYRSFDLFKASIGYVPQQDIVHRRITIQRALTYTARLRLPEDTSTDEIRSYIKRVLDLVGLPDKATQPIDTPMPLSGGQFKRVSLAVELVSNPGILFLDEVTSGLDAGTDKKMMRLFADLAADQKTVVCVTHTLENIDACHLVIVLFSGRLAYFGPPAGVTDFFKIRRPSDVYETLENAPAEQWAERYTASALHRDYVAQRLAGTPDGADSSPDSIAVQRRPTRRFDWRQAGILTHRYLDLILSDRRNLVILLLQAPIIGAVIGLVFGGGQTLAARATAESQISFMLIISAIWFGCLNSAREVVKELPVYTRERSVNLGIGPYVASKVLPLAGLCALQCLVLLLVVSFLISIPGGFIARTVALFLSGMAATALGLTVSAIVTTTDKAVAMVPILLIPQVVLSNAIVTLGTTSEMIAKASMISFWGFDCMKATLAAEVRALLPPVRGSYMGDLVMLLLFFTAFLATAVVALRLRDRSR